MQERCREFFRRVPESRDGERLPDRHWIVFIRMTYAEMQDLCNSQATKQKDSRY